MKPTPLVYEKVPTDEFVFGTIENVEYEQDHTFTFKGVESIAPGVRLVLLIEGMKYPKKTRWMRFMYGEMTNLYKKFILPLVENARPDMDFDLDNLKGLKIKMLWKDDKNPKYQSIETIRPVGSKVLFGVASPKEDMAESEEIETDDQVPF